MKEGLVSAKPTRNSLVREVMNGMLRVTTKVWVSMEVMGGGRGEGVKKAKVLSYIEYLGLYRSFIDSVDDDDLKKYHTLITFHYTIDGTSN